MGSIPTGTKLRSNLVQVVHTYVPLPPSSITCYWSRNLWCSLAGKATAGLAESNGSLPPKNDLKTKKVTCRLIACTSGSAPSPTLELNLFTQQRHNFFSGRVNNDTNETKATEHDDVSDDSNLHHRAVCCSLPLHEVSSYCHSTCYQRLSVAWSTAAPSGGDHHHTALSTDNKHTMCQCHRYYYH